MILTMRQSKRVVLIVTMLVLALAFGASTAAEFADDAGLVAMVEPVDVTLVSSTGPCIGEVDTTMVVDVKVAQVEGLYGIEFMLNYDPDVLQVVDKDASMPGTQIQLGAIFGSRRPMIVGSVDEQAGTIHYGASLLVPDAPIAGTGSLARITFRVKSKEATVLTFDGTRCLLPKDLRLVGPTEPAYIAGTWHDAAFSSDCARLFIPMVSVR